jgi:hypothetical protein
MNAPDQSPVSVPAKASAPAALLEDRSVRFVVAALTRRGAYLQVNRNAAALFSDRNGFVEPLASLDMDAFRALAGADWIELNVHGQWVLGKAGSDAVRRARSGATPDEVITIPPLPAGRPSPGPETKMPARPAADRESPLGWLHSRRDKQGRQMLSTHAYDAGERLRADFWFAAMTPRITASWSPVSSDRNAQRGVPGAGCDMNDNVVAAKERVRRALAAVGPELSGILIDVCCHEKGIEDAERESGWPVRSGRIVLQLALERLARHYGLAPLDAASTWASEGRIRAWGSADYRPSL